MLRINSITKSYHQRGTVLKDLSLHLKEGDSVSVIGPSGSGKTTLLNIIGLLDRPDSGEILFRGERLLNYSSDESAHYRNRNLGFVFQDHLLLPYLTVKENILLPLLASDLTVSYFGELEQHASKLMERTGIADLAGKYPFQISGGEAQRATLVRSMVNKPSLLLADEPTGSLDRDNALKLGELLLEMNREMGVTLILATHSYDLAEKMAIRMELVGGALEEVKGKAK
jgi:ABC-type lipoprotein export system ATPase subunit